MIPRILHFTWKSQALPRVMQAYYDAWVRLHPGWDIRLWTDETMRDFVAEAYPDLLPTYDGYPRMIQRADAFRYLVLGRLGGVYADLDVEPFQNIDPLLSLDCFVGVEPLEHIGTDRIHQGVPILLSNAFMGSVPGHGMWREVCRLLPDLAHLETFYSTGPSMVTAVALRLPRAERPALLLPEVWSPLLSNGLRTRSDARLRALLPDVGRVVGAESGTLVSHMWHTTWVPWHKRNSPLSVLFQWPTTLKWWWRKRRYPELAATVVPDPATPYFDQHLEPPTEWPRVHIALHLRDGALSPDLAAALRGLSYPRQRLSVAIHVARDVTGAAGSADDWSRQLGLPVEIRRLRHTGTAALSECLDVLSTDAAYLLLIDGSVRSIPADAIAQMLAARRPVAVANCVDAAGANADSGVFRYRYGGKFQVLYKDGGTEGPVRRDPGHRSYLGEQTAFNILPLDGTGGSFVLVCRDVLEAGIGFADGPYKLHQGGEAFAIMARDRGYEVAGLPGVAVVRQT